MAQLGNFTFRCPPSQLVRGERSGLPAQFQCRTGASRWCATSNWCDWACDWRQSYFWCPGQSTWLLVLPICS